ncbi:hypothetical protein F5Y01DRAFT_325067 [Xylaria sp. FL0043]|nr:hypothetical protein F5Y01DRAFT_325067 [Xylaria sp. FL0043]
MAALNADSFQRALSRFKKTLPPDLIREFSTCTLQDVHGICRGIQQEHGREGILRNMRRLESFVEAMEQFGKVIEVFVNVNDFIGFIWGPIKFLLGIARTYLDSFDKLLGVYEQVGDAIPGLQQYSATFEKYPPLAQVLEDYYSDILNFHQAALRVFKRPKWKTLFHSTWKTFDADFKSILHSLASRRQLLESEKGSASLYEIQVLRQELSQKNAEQSQQAAKIVQEQHRARISSIRESLQAPNYPIDQETATEDRHGSKSGLWIFEHPHFQEWSKNDATGHDALYVNGVPGAGKTTLMSAVIEKLQERKRVSAVENCCVAYFFFKHNHVDKGSHNSLLRAILEQLIEQDPIMSDHLFREISVIEGTKLRSTQTLEKLVRAALRSYQISYMILDGLDESSQGEASKSISYFLSITKEEWKGPDAMLRVLFCGQRDGILDKLLVDQPQISLESTRHVEDIRLYCETFCKQIGSKFGIASSMEEDIASRVAGEARGMFLYARVVLGNLLSQTKLSGLKREVEPGTFPRGIEKAYERVAVRILEKSSEAEREDALKILAWVICAKRHLRWREIQSLFCVDPIAGSVEYEERRLRVTCKDICGSLIDVHRAADRDIDDDADDIIRIVHETAREFLIRKQYLTISIENDKLAAFCLAYLTSKPFQSGITENEIVLHASQGYYSLQDYAVRYWFEHTRESAQLAIASGQDEFEETMALARRFLEIYGYLGDEEVTVNTAKLVIGLPTDIVERNKKFDLELRTTIIRQGIETLHNKSKYPGLQEGFNYLHETTATYKCPKPWCEFFTVGFGNAEDLIQHINRHNLPFRCPNENCFASLLGFDTPLKLKRHRTTYHSEPSEDFKFPRVASKKKAATISSALSQGDLSRAVELLDSTPSAPASNQRTVSIPSSFWTTTEASKFPSLLSSFGSDWNAIASHMGTKTATMVENYYTRRRGSTDWDSLVKEGNDIRARRFSAGTLLHLAVESGLFDICMDVLERGADPNHANPDHHSQTALHAAVLANNLDIAHLLISQPGCTPDKVDGLGRSPFMEACALGHLDIVKLLLETGQIQVDRRPDERPVSCKSNARAWTTPLGYAYLENHKSVVSYLLQQGQPSSFVSKFRRQVVESVNANDSPISKSDDKWSCTFNTDIRQKIEVDLVHNFPHNSVVTCVAFSIDGSLVATGCDRTVHIFEVITGSLLSTLRQTGEETEGDHYVRCVSFSQNGTYLATGSEDGMIRLWNFRTGLMRQIFSGHQAAIYSLAFAPNGEKIVSGSGDRTVKVWDVETSTCIFALNTEDGISSVAISKKHIASGSLDGSVKIWDSITGDLLSHLQEPHGHQDPVFSITISPDGRTLISGSLDKTIKMWDLNDLEVTRDNKAATGHLIRTLEGHRDSVLDTQMTHDARWIISGSKDRTVQFWDARTGHPQFVLEGHENSVIKATASPDGVHFATASGDFKARIWTYRAIAW